MRRETEDGLVAGAVAAVVGGLPSTTWACIAGADPLQATLAAGTTSSRREQA